MEYNEVISLLKKIRRKLKNEEDEFTWDTVNIAPAKLMSLFTYGLLDITEKEKRKFKYKLSKLGLKVLEVLEDTT